MPLPLPRLLAASAGLLLLALGCGGGEGPSGETRRPTSIVVVAGDQQSGPVGEALPTPVRVRASDSRGGVPGATVTLSLPQFQGGQVTPASGVTDASGEFTAVWSLGATVGTQTLQASVSGVTPVVVTATGLAGAAAVVIPLTSTSQFVVVGRSVPVLPSVRVTDAFGNPIGGAQVTFTAGITGGVLGGAGPIATDPSGIATVGTWAIGPNASPYTVLAAIPGGASALFTAFGIPATVQFVAGTGQVANVGTQLPIAPRIVARRDDGSPLPGVSVTFVPQVGSGVVSGTSRVTAADGTAQPGGWVLGLTAGINRMNAEILGMTPTVVEATGIPATPAAMTPSGGQSQAGFFGNFTAAAPAVVVTDAGGNPVAGAEVVFDQVQGGGVLFGARPQTDFLGRAALGAWRLGSQDATQVVRATLGNLPQVLFTTSATPVPASAFAIELRYVNTPSAAQKAAFDLAVARWQQAIVGDLPDEFVDLPPSPFGCYPALSETVDDVIIYVELIPIDGVNGVLGRAGPCLYRDGSFHTAVGRMLFDTADLATLEASGQLNSVILHEMGHVLGIGTFWTDLGLLSGSGSADPFFTGASGRAAFFAAAAPGTTYTGNPVPVEAGGGSGTREAHWREATLVNELMTGRIDAGFNPLSAISLASLRDHGYVVNDAVADPYSFQARLLGGFHTGTPSGLPGGFLLAELPLPGPVGALRGGRIVRWVPRQ